MNVPALAALLGATLALSSCAAAGEDSAEDFQGERRAVAVVVEDLEDAGAARDGNEICQDLFTEELRTRIREASGRSCPAALDDALDDADAFDVNVTSVTISGTTATVKVKGEAGDDERTDTFTLEKVGSAWRIDSLGQ